MDVQRYRIETKDVAKVAEQIVFPSDIATRGRVTLPKAGFLNSPEYVQSLEFKAWANRGRRFVFRWEED
ncbi:hypothetical protein ACFY36_15860 [Actinoplanes sp. NPDC000266]